MGTAKLLILENKLGQKVRTFSVESETLHIVYLKESRRIEAFASLQELDENEVAYKLIKKINLNNMDEEDATILEGLGSIRLYPAAKVVQSPSYELPQEDDEEQLKTFIQKSSLVHLLAVFSLIMASWIVATYFTKKEETPLVTIVIPQETPKTVVEKREPRPTVKVSEKKIKQTKKIVKMKAVPKHKPLVKQPKIAFKKSVNVQRMGALAALGGVPNGKRGYEGLDTQSMKNIRSAGRGNGGGGFGASGQGGMKGYLPGSGLIAGTSGSGGRAESAGGYGTKGVGGGKAGYGKISLVGGTSGMSLPLDDEASVEGGLDKDQIAAVINRHQGQIVYCYEKGLQAQPSIGGRVAVDFVIGPNGRITKAKVAQSSLGSRYVENCMIERMKSWQFPRPVGNVSVDVLYPFELTRVSSR
ncbi:TonB family protein [Bdellovibrio sp. HCB2-146]|uniref:AgmX/PglI C-terminal domain-containing protein n=1 Tax=Bdellovibrio sp. HCB2-146 TaxID=3394362 RepID=UPI0039BD1CCB